MKSGAIALALTAAVGLGGCKDKKTAAPPPTPAAGAGSQAAPTGPANPAAKPKYDPTAVDTGYEARRAELLRRGNPELMKDAPIISSTAPDIKPDELIKKLGPDLLQVGTMKVDLAKGRIEIPGKVGAASGPLEYVAVTENGKAYESLLVIDTNAIELRLALSLLGYEGTIPQGPNHVVSAPTAADTVMLAAIVDGKERPISAYMVDKKRKKAPPDHPWQVVGFAQEDRDQSLLTKDFITLVARDYFAPMRYSVDPGNPYAGPNEGYTGNTKLLPAKDVPVTLVIKRGPEKPPVPAPAIDVLAPDIPMPPLGGPK